MMDTAIRSDSSSGGRTVGIALPVLPAAATPCVQWRVVRSGQSMMTAAVVVVVVVGEGDMRQYEAMAGKVARAGKVATLVQYLSASDLAA